MKEPPADRYQVRIRALAHGGEFVGDIVGGATSGMKAFVRGAAPGELLEVSTIETGRGFVRSRPLRVLEPSADRITPPCPYVGDCGGCDLQHLSIGAQRSLKRSMIEDALRVQGRIVPRDGVTLVGADLPPFGYRHRVGLHLNSDGQIGFYAAGSGRVVDIDSCLLATSELNAGLAALRLRRGALAPAVSGVVRQQAGTRVHALFHLHETTTERRPPPSPRELEALGRPFLDAFDSVEIRRNNGVLWRSSDAVNEPAREPPPVGHFSQVNDAGNAILIDTVRALLAPGDITELYAGSGNFALVLAGEGRTIDAVEIDPALVARGKAVARERGLSDRLRFFAESCESYVKRTTPRRTVLLDPPRSGAKEIVRRMDPARTSAIVYVSCNLATLVRDLRTLVERGYEVTSVRLVDMFSQTHHVETVTHVAAKPD